MTCTIRSVHPGEEPRVVEMSKALITHLGEETDNFDEDRFLVDAFGEDPQFTLFVAATDDDVLAGYVSFHDAYEPSYTARGVYVIDLYVADGMRGKGVGTALLQAVAKDAHKRGRNFIWLVTSSDAARGYYDGLMNLKSEVTAYALAGEDFLGLMGN